MTAEPTAGRHGETAPDGYMYVWVPTREIPCDNRWQIVEPDAAKQCRRTDHGLRCEATSVVRLNRAFRNTDPPRWWHYCEQHMFGRRIVNGVVETEILAPVVPLPV